MTRPADLPTALQAWAKANYAAGPAWGGTAQRSTPVGSALVPGVSLAAEVANYLHGNAFDAAQAAINAVGQIPALNWSPLVSLGSGSSNALGWSDAEQAWYVVVSASVTGQQSFDYGKTWTNITIASAYNPVFDIAFDTSGNGVIVGNTRDVQEGPFVAYGTAITWTNHVTALGSTPNLMAQVVYDPAHSLWCILQNGAAVATSTNRSVWTNRAIPGTWVLGNSNYVRLGVGNGILVAASRDTASLLRTMRSADGGVTWTNDQTVAVNAGITMVDANGTVTRPAWSSTDALWYIAVNQTATRKTQVFSSPDGITWASAATLLANDCAFLELVVLGSLLVGINNDGRIFASWNKGVNWWRCGYSGTNFLTGAKSGGGGIGYLRGALWTSSQRFGLPVTAA